MSVSPVVQFWRNHGADTRTSVVLANHGIDTLQKLSEPTRRCFMAMPNMGKKSVAIIEDILMRNGMAMQRDAPHTTKSELWYAQELRRFGWTVTPPNDRA